MKLKTLSKLTALLLALMMLFSTVASAEIYGLDYVISDYANWVSHKQQEEKAYCSDELCTYGWIAVNECPIEKRYDYFMDLGFDADKLKNVLNHVINKHSGEPEAQDALCTCYITSGVLYPYRSNQHATYCPWYGDGETERTLTDVNNTGITVTGNIPADVKLAVTTATGTRPTMDLSHFNTYLVYPTIKGYDIALLNADGTEYNLADGTTVTVNIPNAWNSSMVNPIADVYHMTGDANGTVEYKTSRNDSVILESDYSITFETNGFSEYWVSSGSVTLNSLSNGQSHTVRMVAGTTASVTVSDNSVDVNSSNENVARGSSQSSGSNSRITISATSSAPIGGTATITLRWTASGNRSATVNVIIVSEAEAEKAEYLNKFTSDTYPVYLAVRQDGNLPGEPSVQGSGGYSFFNSSYSTNGMTFAESANGIIDTAILDHDKFFYTSVDGTQTIGMVDSTGETIRTMVNGVDWDRLLTAAAGTGRITASNGTSVTSANVSNYKIVPYVIKCQEDSQGKGWHIDCAIVLKEAVMLSYDINIPAGLVIESDDVGVPNNETGTPPATFTVGAMSGLTTIDGQANAIRVSPNYVFMFQGWNTKTDGSGEWYQPGQPITINESTTLHAIWNSNPAIGTGNLEIRKIVRVDNGEEIDTDQLFSFEVRIRNIEDGEEATGSYDYTIYGADGVAIPDGRDTIESGGTVSLKHGQYVVIYDLPANDDKTNVQNVTITEIPVEGYTADWTDNTTTVAIQGGRRTETICYNTKAPSVGSLTITKVVEGVDNGAIPADTVFTFIVRDAKGTSQTVTVPANGSFTVENLPIGECTVTEDEPAKIPDYNFKQVTVNSTPAQSTTVTIMKDATETVTFTNVYEKATADLTITKKVSGTTKTDTFEFTVTLTKENGDALSGEYAIEGANVSTIRNGGKFTLTVDSSGSASAKINGLPIGTKYTVTETPKAGYTANSSTLSGEIDANGATAAFTNTYSVGNLSIQKTVVGATAPTDAKFSFKVDFTPLNDIPLETSYDYVITKVSDSSQVSTGAITDGGTIVLQNGQIATISNIQTGVGYTVTETTDTTFPYTVTKTADTGTIPENETAAATFTNTYTKGDLAITKTVSGDSADQSKYFDFTVTLPGMTGNVTYLIGSETKSATLTNNQLNLQLKHNETATIKDIPHGTVCTVTETAVAGYATTANGAAGLSGTATIAQGTVVTVPFVNTYSVADLTIEKKVVTEENVTAPNDEFTIAVTLIAGANAVLATSYPYSISGVEGTKTLTLDTNGSGTITLKDGQTATIKGIQVGTTYTVEETSKPDYYDVSYSPANGVGTVGTDNAVTVTNTYKTGELTVTKAVVGTTAPKDASFTFTLAVKYENEPVVATILLNGDQKVLDANGQCTFTLQDGKEAKFTGIPDGATYTVTEDANASDFPYTVTVNGEEGSEGNGKIDVEVPSTEAFVNTYKFNDLTITKDVVNESKSLYEDVPAAEFPFTLTLVDANGATLTETYNVTKSDTTTATITLGTVFNLKDGESITIHNLPVGATYTVAEDEVAGFVLTQKNGYTNPIAADGTYTAEFTNEYRVGQLTISKEVNGADAPADEEFTFTVALPGTTGKFDYYVIDTETKAAIEGKDGTITSTENTITLQHNQTAVIDRIPAGVEYTVTETADPDYTTTIKVSGKDAETGTGTITANTTSAVEFTNTYNYSHLTITKTGMKSGESAIFEVTNNKNGTTFTVVVPNEGFVTIGKLLIGDIYTVTESGSWTWLYTPSTPQSVEITEGGKVVSVTNSGTDKWLHDESGVINTYGTVGGTLIH